MARKIEDVRRWMNDNGYRSLVCCPGGSDTYGGVLFYFKASDFPDTPSGLVLDDSGMFAYNGAFVSYDDRMVPSNFSIHCKGACWKGTRTIEMYALIPGGPCVFRHASEQQTDWYKFLIWCGYTFNPNRTEGIMVVAGSIADSDLERQLAF